MAQTIIVDFNITYTGMYVMKEYHEEQLGLLKYEAYAPCGYPYRSIDNPINSISVMGGDNIPYVIGTGATIKTPNNELNPICPTEGYLAADPAGEFILNEDSNYLLED